jgi:ribonuclease J
MKKNSNIGRSLGHVRIPEGIQIQPRELDDWPDEKIVIISTGSQGEPLSALRRMAHADHHQIQLKAGDTIIFSATPIPATSARSTRSSTGCSRSAARSSPPRTRSSTRRATATPRRSSSC